MWRVEKEAGSSLDGVLATERLVQVVIDCSGPPGERNGEETGYVRKRDAMLSQLERRMALRTLVFCNTIQGCRQVKFLPMHSGWTLEWARHGRADGS